MKTVENMSAGMMFCVEINETKTVDNSTYDEWLGDSGGPSAHINCSVYGMKHKITCEVCVTISTGEVTTAKFKGDLDLVSDNGKKNVLLDILYIPSMKRNLLATNKFIQKGAFLVANKNCMKIQKEKFEITLPSRSEAFGNMYCLEAKQVVSELINDVAVIEENNYEKGTTPVLPKLLDINVVHG